MKPIKFKDLILQEDQDYILINKPPFISTLEDRNDPQNILALAKEYAPDAQVCHRLDKDTSGVLAIARNPAAYRHLSMQFESRAVKKIYHAVVDGTHQFDNVLVDAPILKQNDGTVKISRLGKEAQTYFTTLQLYKSLFCHLPPKCQKASTPPPFNPQFHTFFYHGGCERFTVPSQKFS